MTTPLEVAAAAKVRLGIGMLDPRLDELDAAVRAAQGDVEKLPQWIRDAGQPGGEGEHVERPDRGAPSFIAETVDGPKVLTYRDMSDKELEYHMVSGGDADAMEEWIRRQKAKGETP